MTIGKEQLYDWWGGNVWLFKQINSISGGYYDLAMQNITLLGDKKLLPYFLAAIVAYALITMIGRLVTKQAGNKHYAEMWFGIFAVLAVGFVVSYSTISYLKDHFSYPRPYATLASGEVRHLEAQAAEKANQSFPSGHVAIITTIILALWPAFSGNFKWFGAALILGVAWSRIALGVHFPVDVLYSFIIVLFEILLVRSIVYWLLNRLFGLRC